MNRHHPLDDAFREKLQGLSTETPLHLWEQIDQKRNWKYRFLNRVRQYSPFATVLASVAIAGGALLLWNNQQPTLTAFPVPASALEQQMASNASTTTPSTETIEQHKETVESLAFNKPTRPAANSPQPNNTLAASTTGGSGAETAPASLPASKTSPQLARPDQMAIAESLSELAAESQAAPTQPPVNSHLSNAPTLTPAPAPRRVAALPMLPAQSAKAEVTLPGIINPDPKCARFGANNWQAYIDLMVSPDLAFNDLQARDANFEDYAKSRRETENFVFAYSGGIRLSLEAKNGLAFRTGVNYSQVNEKFTYFNGTERREIIEPVRDNQGNVIGYDTVVTVGERYKVSQNTYRMLDIPFIAGYEMEVGDFGLAVNGGAYLNLLFRQEGDFLSPETLTPTPLNPEDPNMNSVFKRQAGVGFYGSVALTYATKSGLELLLEPHFKMFPNSVTQDQYAVQQRHMSAGVFMGIRKHL